jgi:hypothetical protein
VQHRVSEYDAVVFLLEELAQRSVDVAVLQETGRLCDLPQLPISSHGRLIVIPRSAIDASCRSPGDSYFYGQAFYISNDLLPYYQGYKVISNRLAYIQFRFSPNSFNPTTTISPPPGFQRHSSYPPRSRLLSIANVYAPTSQFGSKHPAAFTSFYDQLNDLTKQLNTSSSLLYIAGDFNAQIGHRLHEQESFIGHFGRGRRNRSGSFLAEYLSVNKLYALNTRFSHKECHRSTWHGEIKLPNGDLKKIHTQIDYILTPQSKAHLASNARSYSGHKASPVSKFLAPDHGIVIADIRLSRFYYAYHIDSSLLPLQDPSLFPANCS